MKEGETKFRGIENHQSKGDKGKGEGGAKERGKRGKRTAKEGGRGVR